jgi:hypothetical protein
MMTPAVAVTAIICVTVVLVTVVGALKNMSCDAFKLRIAHLEAENKRLSKIIDESGIDH